MRIHEYQAQSLFSDYGIPVPPAQLVTSAQSAEEAASLLLGNGTILVKAQIHAGGRGKAGGVKVCHTPEEAGKIAERMIGSRLITKQSGKDGKMVRKLLITEGVNIKKEYYLSITMDRHAGMPVIIASSFGGMDIEDVAVQQPDKVIRQHISPTIGLTDYACRNILCRIGINWSLSNEFIALAQALYQLFIDKDCSMIEINPLVETDENHFIAVDAKVEFDSNAHFRHPEYDAMRDLDEEDPKEIEATRYDLNYISLTGNIGCMVNGAGLAMATMDIIEAYGGHPANFLDVGGSATAEKVAGAFRILLSDTNIKVILVNIFGGIMKCDIIANGIVDAVKCNGLKVPLVVRLAGTNALDGLEILDRSRLNIDTANSLTEAAKKVVAVLK